MSDVQLHGHDMRIDAYPLLENEGERVVLGMTIMNGPQLEDQVEILVCKQKWTHEHIGENHNWGDFELIIIGIANSPLLDIWRQKVNGETISIYR